MSVFGSDSFADHEQILFCRDRASGLRAIIAIHDRTLGPATGGCRMWPYASEEEAITDVLRLSRGMSFKNAMADLPLGGGKSVIIGDPRKDKTPEMMRAFGRFIEGLGGAYITAEDVGTTVRDIEIMGEVTRFVAGRSKGPAASGDPSPVTAYGVFVGIKAALAHRFGSDSLSRRVVAVQGLGNVGRNLCRQLAEEGADLVVADIDRNRVQDAVDAYGARAVPVDAIHRVEADVFAPCALGGGLNERTIPVLGAPIVAGGANNQLAEHRDGWRLFERDILYAPDYVINAGGIINVSAEISGRYDRGAVMVHAGRIADTLTRIFERSGAEKRPTHEIADAMAIEKIESARRSHAA